MATKITPWTIVSSKYLVQDKWMTLRADSCTTDEGVVIEPYYVVEASDWVHVLAINKAQQILLTTQYRHGRKKIANELVAGTVDPGEEPIVTAKRELLEETGYSTDQWDHVGSYASNAANVSNQLHCYVAHNVEKTAEQKLDDSETIDVSFVTLEQLGSMLDSGTFSEALCIHSLFVCLRHLGLALPKNAT